MSFIAPIRFWDRSTSAVFFRVREEHGGLSNMAGGFPLKIGSLIIHSSEALYQACRFPFNPDLQRRVLEEKNPLKSKWITKPHRAEHTRKDWEPEGEFGSRVDFMRWVLGVKLLQNWDRFGELLLATLGRDIVEQSSKDQFWGAMVQPSGMLLGQNVLGVLLMELRDRLVAEDPELLVVRPPDLPYLYLLGDPLPVLRR